jgi:hypothetical protein
MAYFNARDLFDRLSHLDDDKDLQSANAVSSRVARWSVAIWVNFDGSCNRKSWYIL